MYELICAGMMIVLSGFALWDILYRRFRVGSILIILGLSIVCKLYMGDVSFVHAAAGAAVGGGFLGISKFTNEALGYADSLWIMALGIFLGVWDLLLLLLLAFSLSALFTGVGVVWKKFSKDFSIPFIPFLAVSYAGVILMG